MGSIFKKKGHREFENWPSFFFGKNNDLSLLDVKVKCLSNQIVNYSLFSLQEFPLDGIRLQNDKNTIVAMLYLEFVLFNLVMGDRYAYSILNTIHRSFYEEFIVLYTGVGAMMMIRPKGLKEPSKEEGEAFLISFGGRYNELTRKFANVKDIFPSTRSQPFEECLVYQYSIYIASLACNPSTRRAQELFFFSFMQLWTALQIPALLSGDPKMLYTK